MTYYAGNVTAPPSVGIGAGVNLTGGVPAATGAGGTSIVSGGAGGSTSGNGGLATLKGGVATDGNGGGASVTGSAATGTSRTGGAVTITAGTSTTGVTGGAITVTAGAGGTTDGAGGAITIAAGAAGVANANGGSLTLRGGALAGTGLNGSILIGTTNTLGVQFGVASPAQIVTTVNDYTGTDNCVYARLNSDASRSITGLANGTSGRTLTIINVGAQNIVLNDENAGSVAGNRIITGQADAADITLLPLASVTLMYDNTTTRWRVISKNGLV